MKTLPIARLLVAVSLILGSMGVSAANTTPFYPTPAMLVQMDALYTRAAVSFMGMTSVEFSFVVNNAGEADPIVSANASDSAALTSIFLGK